MSRRGLRLAIVVVFVAAAWAAVSSPGTTATGDNILRISLAQATGLDYIDPALSFTAQGWSLIDTYCARLLTNPDRPPPAGFRIVPEVAVSLPAHSRDFRTFTFTLRRGFRFSNGQPVRASAFARAIERTLAPNLRSPGSMYTRDILGAADVLAGRATSLRGVLARGNTLTVRLAQPDPDFPKRFTLPYFCAVPPGLPSDPEGVGAPFHSAGPYYVTEYRPGERVVIRRNPNYGGTRPHHVDGFDVDLRTVQPRDMIVQVDRGEADWGLTLATLFFDPTLGLEAKYGINRSRLFVDRGLSIRMLAFNTSRPLFRNNPALRRAINFALDRKQLQGLGGPTTTPPTDQYLPFAIPGFTDADIYPLDGPDLTRAKALASGKLRGGKAVLLTPSFALAMVSAQLVKQQLEPLGLDVTFDPIPWHLTSAQYFDRLSDPDAGWDMAMVIWGPNVPDPYGYLNLLLGGKIAGSTTLTRFESATYDSELRRVGTIVEPLARQRAYGELDIRLARDFAPVAALSVVNEVTFVSDRVGCMVRRPVLDLTSVCLK